MIGSCDISTATHFEKILFLRVDTFQQMTILPGPGHIVPEQVQQMCGSSPTHELLGPCIHAEGVSLPTNLRYIIIIIIWD